MLTKPQLQQITAAIREAENQTSGEIRVYIARRCKGNPIEEAIKKFYELNMQKTFRGNGVLIYVAPKDKKAAIVGDEGIHTKINGAFWNETLTEMLSYFAKGLITEGLCKAVERAGKLINAHYPVTKDDLNELSDDVIQEN